jgi:tetraacyldisaccharide 4'-kinase
MRWLWMGRGIGSRFTRLLLLPLSAVYGIVVASRVALYRLGVLRRRSLPLPAVAVGNLTVGGAGKTPLAAWIAAFCVRAGRRPGVLLRGYGADEPLVHRRLVPTAIVVADPDRVAGAAAAVAQGCDVLVLDDAYQRLDIARDLNIALVSAEQLPPRIPTWVLPSGPWREYTSALGRADLIVVTRKRVDRAVSRAVADWIVARWPDTPVAEAALALGDLAGMRTGTVRRWDELRQRSVVAVAGVADPESFAVQVRAAGATVQLMAYQDHHAYGPDDIAALVRATTTADYVVVTEKDAVKLRPRWPPDAAEPLVAGLAWTWERNGDAVTQALERLLAAPISRTRDLTDTHP